MCNSPQEDVSDPLLVLLGGREEPAGGRGAQGIAPCRRIPGLGSKALLFSPPSDPAEEQEDCLSNGADVELECPFATLAINHPACDKVITFSLELFIGKPIKGLPCKHNNKEAGQ